MTVEQFDDEAHAIGGADQYFGAGSEFVRACLFIIAELENKNREEIERKRTKRITSNRNVLIACQFSLQSAVERR